MTLMQLSEWFASHPWARWVLVGAVCALVCWLLAWLVIKGAEQDLADLDAERRELLKQKARYDRMVQAGQPHEDQNLTLLRRQAPKAPGWPSTRVG